MHYCRHFALVLASALFSALFAQSATPPSNAVENFRVSSTLVLVPVSVTDNANRYVLGLDKDNFKIFEDAKEQKIKQFSGEDAPLSVGLLVDTSGSMGSKLDLCREAVVQFLKTMNARDEAFLVEFSDSARVVAPLTHNTKEITDALPALKPGGMTALFDAVWVGLRQLKNSVNPRKTLIVISDGGDNNSAFSAKEILDKVLEDNVQIYAMGVFEPYASLGLGPAELRGPRLLSRHCRTNRRARVRGFRLGRAS